MNVITTSAFTYNFEEPKKTCGDEYFMLTRAGFLSFQKMGFFMTDIMDTFNCKIFFILSKFSLTFCNN